MAKLVQTQRARRLVRKRLLRREDRRDASSSPSNPRPIDLFLMMLWFGIIAGLAGTGLGARPASVDRPDLLGLAQDQPAFRVDDPGGRCVALRRLRPAVRLGGKESSGTRAEAGLRPHDGAARAQCPSECGRTTHHRQGRDDRGDHRVGYALAEDGLPAASADLSRHVAGHGRGPRARWLAWLPRTSIPPSAGHSTGCRRARRPRPTCCSSSWMTSGQTA